MIHWVNLEKLSIRTHNRIGLYSRVPFIFTCIIILPFLDGTSLGISLTSIANWVQLVFGIWCFILGSILLLKTRTKLKAIFGGENMAPSLLITDGIYGVVRNPMYTGFLFIGLSISLAFPWFEVILMEFLGMVGLISYAQRFEEPLVRRIFGDPYSHYQGQTPAFFNFPLMIFFGVGCGILLFSFF